MLNSLWYCIQTHHTREGKLEGLDPGEGVLGIGPGQAAAMRSGVGRGMSPRAQGIGQFSVPSVGSGMGRGMGPRWAGQGVAGPGGFGSRAPPHPGPLPGMRTDGF